MPSNRLGDRWAELLGLIREEFLRSGFDPINFHPSEAQLKLRAQLTFGGGPLEWHTQSLTRDQLLEGDLRMIAVEFYRDYRKELGARADRN